MLKDLKYEEGLLWDESYKTLFNVKLQEVKAVIKTNDFLTYRTSYKLLDELKKIYSNNLKDYYRYYRNNLDDINKIINSVNSNEIKILPFRKKEILQLAGKAKNQLEIHSYKENNKAKKLITDCKQRIERLVLEHQIASKSYREFNYKKEKYYDSVWHEEMFKVDKIQEDCHDFMFNENYDFRGKDFITLNVECISKVEDLIEIKSSAINNDVASISKKYNPIENDYAKEQIKKLKSYLTKRITKEEYQLKYENAISRIKSSGRSDRIINIVAVILIVGLGLTIGFFIFKFLYGLHFLLGYAFLLVYGGAAVVVLMENVVEYLMDKFIK